MEAKIEDRCSEKLTIFSLSVLALQNLASCPFELKAMVKVYILSRNRIFVAILSQSFSKYINFYVGTLYDCNISASECAKRRTVSNGAYPNSTYMDGDPKDCISVSKTS